MVRFDASSEEGEISQDKTLAAMDEVIKNIDDFDAVNLSISSEVNFYGLSTLGISTKNIADEKKNLSKSILIPTLTQKWLN
ncbi:MAG: hypothetical protein MZU91_05535 [Desulfosudis oleivorans]|nr:hypothetical protein [Desulfosudis oleivorans]